MKRFAALMLALILLAGVLPSALADEPHTHVWKTVSRVNPTCTAGGHVTYVCSCGARKAENLPALGHEWAEKVYTGYADCTHYGVFYWVCSRCGAHSDTGNDAPLGHDWDEGVVTKAPTATEEGIRTYTCKRDPSHTKTEPIPATGADEKPGLTIKWDYDEIFHDHLTYITTEITDSPAILDYNDGASVWHTITNTGNVPLMVIHYYVYGDGFGGSIARSKFDPGASKQEMCFTPFFNTFIIPGSETKELFGSTTVSFYCVGYDPETYENKNNPGTELCRTETITRTWYMGKDVDPDSEDHCALIPETIGDTGAKYTLHTCSEHLETALAAQELSLAGDFAGAAELWRAEAEKLYASIPAVLGEAAETAEADKQAFFDYADAVASLFGDEKAAETLRLRCADLCCVINTAPARLPLGLTGEYEASDASESFVTSGREIGALDGSDCEVAEHYAGFAAEAMADTRALFVNAADGQADGLFAMAGEIWKTGLEQAVNAAYKKADRNVKPLIAGWNMSLDILGDADGELYSLFYRSAPETAEELVMDLYKDAALLMGGID
ncbi:MAG: hypothetical protein IKI24_01080 [Clostridia bacterium]|nr:hypothetical protein [Clostridia bacterium]